MKLSDNLKEQRKAHGLSQEGLAEALGVSRQAVAKWEKGDSAPSTAHLLRLSELFGVPVEELAGQAPQGESLAQQLHRLDREERAKARLARKKRWKGNFLAGLCAAVFYLGFYLLGRVLWGEMEGRSLLGWLRDTDSTTYLFGWLSHQKIYWWAMGISVLTALLGWKRLSAVTVLGFLAGLGLGELLGPDPAGAAIGHSHKGWLIWGLCFLGSVILGIVVEKVRRPRETV